MKNIIKYSLKVFLLGGVLAVAGCSDDEEGVVPSEVTNLTAETTPGRIVLRWNTPADANIHYIEVDYFDPAKDKNVRHTASIYADSCEIADTRAKYGEYTFTVRSVSESGTKSGDQSVSMISEAALPTYISTQINLTTDDLSTNAQEVQEGPIADIIDGDYSTFFHSSWSSYISGPHWIQMDLKETLSEYFRFQYVPRNNPKDAPIDFDLLGSTDGENWELIKNFTQDADGLPVTFSYFNSETYKIEKPFSMIRMSVNGTKTYPYSAKDQADYDIYWGPWFAISEFKIWKVEIIDPEAD